ncbi:MAG: macro domain-containing protein [Anaerolineae bacterium]|nr:macro domain-containing protein [Anaerolineae bacterium]MDQ7037218.1 macro domain-containing protein [Anaerolineae bacterium]
MIIYVYGDIFYSPARVLVNPVNIVGTMGNGLAYDFKRFFPTMYESYRELCHDDRFQVGQLLLYRSAHKWVLNFPTKRHFRADSQLEYIEDGLKKFVRTYADQNITSVSFPALGTGSGHLNWDEVRPLMEAYLAPLPISVFIHLFDDDTPFANEQRNTRAMRSWLNGQPKIVSFKTFWKDLLKVVRSGADFHTLESHMPFEVVATEARGRQRLSLKITPKRQDSIFVAETQLRDLWQYIRRAGYILPQNLPAGLEEHADTILALLGELSTMRPVQLATVNSDTIIGLHYIPPIDHKGRGHEIEL